MGKLINGILGGFRGKVGTAVGYFLNDEAIIRSLPKPKRYTAAELRNHDKFKLVQDYLLPIKDLLKVGFNGYYTKTGGYRGAVSYTRKEALVSDDAGFYIDPELFKISGGDLPVAVNPVVALAEPLQLKIDWESSNGSPYDQLMVLVYELSSFKSLQFILEGPFRKDGTFSIELPQTFKGKEVDVYIGFVAKDRSKQSHSQYLGRIPVPA
jgi:hypothetical protein